MAIGDGLEKTLNRLAGTTGLEPAGAANVWAATTGLELVHALNVKAGNSLPNFKDWSGVCQQLAAANAGTTQPLEGEACLASIP